MTGTTHFPRYILVLLSIYGNCFPMVREGNATEETSLHEAAINGDVAQLEQLLRGGNINNIEQENCMGCVPLHCAAESLSHGCLDLLMRYGAQKTVNYKDIFGRTPLQIALNTIMQNTGNNEVLFVQSAIKAIQILIDYGADIAARDNKNNIPITIFMKYVIQADMFNTFCGDIVEYMVKGELAWQKKDPRYFNPGRVKCPLYNLLYEKTICHEHIIRALGSHVMDPKIPSNLRIALFDQDITDAYGNHPIHWVVQDKCVSCLRFLLTHGYHVDVNRVNQWTNSPLFFACMADNFRQRSFGNGIAKKYEFEGKKRLINLLVPYGAEFDRCDANGRTLYCKIPDPSVRILLLRWRKYRIYKCNEIYFLWCIKQLTKEANCYILPPKIRHLIGDYIVGMRPDKD